MNVENAYRLIANELIEYVGKSTWDRIEANVRIFAKMTSPIISWTDKGKTYSSGNDVSFDTAVSASEAALFLRDDLLKTTGQRIWGLTITLFPDGKFRIEYDYDKPEGYEETDETIEVDLNSDLPGQTPTP